MKINLNLIAFFVFPFIAVNFFKVFFILAGVPSSTESSVIAIMLTIPAWVGCLSVLAEELVDFGSITIGKKDE